MTEHVKLFARSANTDLIITAACRQVVVNRNLKVCAVNFGAFNGFTGTANYRTTRLIRMFHDDFELKNWITRNIANDVRAYNGLFHWHQARRAISTNFNTGVIETIFAPSFSLIIDRSVSIDTRWT